VVCGSGLRGVWVYEKVTEATFPTAQTLAKSHRLPLPSDI